MVSKLNVLQKHTIGHTPRPGKAKTEVIPTQNQWVSISYPNMYHHDWLCSFSMVAIDEPNDITKKTYFIARHHDLWLTFHLNFTDA